MATADRPDRAAKPRLTVRELAHELLELGGFVHIGTTCPSWCDLMTERLERDREDGQAEVRALREALEPFGARREEFLGDMVDVCSVCGDHVANCDGNVGRIPGRPCRGVAARRALAAIPGETVT